MTNAELARQLGVDKAVVSRSKARGMPTHSVEAAAEWRDQHLELSRRVDSNPARAYAFGKAHPREVADALARVQRIAAVCQSAIKAGLFEHAAPELRQALAAVPRDVRPQVSLDIELWDALCAHVWPDHGAPLGGNDGPEAGKRRRRGGTGRELTVYAVAAGEPIDPAWLDAWD